MWAALITWATRSNAITQIITLCKTLWGLFHPSAADAAPKDTAREQAQIERKTSETETEDLAHASSDTAASAAAVDRAGSVRDESAAVQDAINAANSDVR